MAYELDHVGHYRITNFAGIQTVTKNNKDQFELSFVAKEFWNSEQNDWESIEPLERTTFMSLEGGALEYTFAKLGVLGFNGDFDNPAFAEEWGTIECKLDAYDGKEKRKWELPRAGGSSNEAADRSRTARMAALWKQQHGNSTKAPAAPAPAPRAAAPAPAPAPAPKPAPPAAAPADKDPVSYDAANADEAYAIFKAQAKDSSDETWSKSLGEYMQAKGLTDQAAMTAEDWKAYLTDACIPF